MFIRWGTIVVRFRHFVLAAALVVVAAGVLWGTGVFGVLKSGGFDDPGSESARAASAIAAELGNQTPDIVVLYSAGTATIDDPAFAGPVASTLAALRQRPEVDSVLTYADTGNPALVSTDRHATYAAIRLRAADDDGKRRAYQTLRPALDAPGVATSVGGVVAFETGVDDLTKNDVSSGEMIAMPVVLVLLVVVFGGVVAAGMPLLIGALAVLGALTAARGIATVTDLSTFAVNSITVLGLGMAIDYALFIVNRFREELAAGRDTPQAISVTMATAGRTVLVSGLTVALALSSLLIFPQGFLRSMGLGGTAAVLIAMLGALTVLPAMLAVLGPRINAWPVPRPRLPWPRRHTAAAATGDAGGWARLAHSVMRRPVLYTLAVLASLAVLAAPLTGARFAGADERILPAGSQPRLVSEQIATHFPTGQAAPIQVLIDGASPDRVVDVTGRIKALSGVTGAQTAAARGTATLITVDYSGPRAGAQAYQAVRAIRALPEPSGVRVLVGGRSAADVDQLQSLGARLPWMAAIMAAVTLVLLFLAFGSVVLPLKAIAMNLVSLAASFGVVSWIFAGGHLAGLLGFTPTGDIEPNLPVFILAVLFGLATDYEVFLLSRVREAYDATGDNTAAVAVGLQRTGRIITTAALLLIVVMAGFASGQIVFAKFIGLGMITAILIDATLVRALLVPATMRLLGRRNWWAPPRLAGIYRRYGIHEPADASPRLDHPALSRTAE
ncbi:MAG: MMPL family transporter [Catenulispora sp.]|nr:MMPL family transporter [Catenulispora sp.]NUR60022.1 MMPL family transporter [Catenulispora sp.]